jgi:hypothetical protein
LGPFLSLSTIAFVGLALIGLHNATDAVRSDALGLPGVYAMWLVIVAVLYPVCRAFAALKARRHDWWLSYL